VVGTHSIRCSSRPDTLRQPKCGSYVLTQPEHSTRSSAHPTHPAHSEPCAQLWGRSPGTLPLPPGDGAIDRPHAGHSPLNGTSGVNRRYLPKHSGNWQFRDQAPRRTAVRLPAFRLDRAQRDVLSGRLDFLLVLGSHPWAPIENPWAQRSLLKESQPRLFPRRQISKDSPWGECAPAVVAHRRPSPGASGLYCGQRPLRLEVAFRFDAGDTPVSVGSLPPPWACRARKGTCSHRRHACAFRRRRGPASVRAPEE